MSADIDAEAIAAVDEKGLEEGLDARLFAFLRSSLWRDAVLPTIAIRLTVVAASYLLVTIFRPEVLSSGNPLEPWIRWDVPHYLDVAREGYVDPNRSVIFPLFPALIAIGSLIAPPLLVGMTISFVATAAAAAGLYQLVRLDYGRTTARTAVLALNVFPTSYWLSASYTDALFLGFVVWTLLSGRRQQWQQAGVLALLAGATRLQGAFLVPALIAEYLVLHRRPGRPLAWFALGLLGLALYLGINLVVYGDPLFFVAIQRATFGLENVAPWTVIGNLVAGVTGATHDEQWVTLYVAPLAAYLILAAVTAWTVLQRPIRPSYAVYTALTLVTLLTLSWPISMPRYLLGVPMLFIGLALLGRRPGTGPAALVASILLMGAFLTLLAMGHWAF